MGSCLSKSGSKGKKGKEEEDKTPYGSTGDRSRSGSPAVEAPVSRQDSASKAGEKESVTPPPAEVKTVPTVVESKEPKIEDVTSEKPVTNAEPVQPKQREEKSPPKPPEREKVPDVPAPQVEHESFSRRTVTSTSSSVTSSTKPVVEQDDVKVELVETSSNNAAPPPVSAFAPLGSVGLTSSSEISSRTVTKSISQTSQVRQVTRTEKIITNGEEIPIKEETVVSKVVRAEDVSGHEPVVLSTSPLKKEEPMALLDTLKYLKSPTTEAPVALSVESKTPEAITNIETSQPVLTSSKVSSTRSVVMTTKLSSTNDTGNQQPLFHKEVAHVETSMSESQKGEDGQMETKSQSMEETSIKENGAEFQETVIKQNGEEISRTGATVVASVPSLESSSVKSNISVSSPKPEPSTVPSVSSELISPSSPKLITSVPVAVTSASPRGIPRRTSIPSSPSTPTSPEPKSLTEMKLSNQSPVKDVRSKTQVNGGSFAHVDAKVVISAPASPPVVASADTNGVTLVTNDVIDYSTDDVNDEEIDELKESVHLVNQRNLIKTLLVDFRPANNIIRSQHKVCTGTRVKQLQAMDKWFLSEEYKESADRVMLVTGATGMGKTSIATEFCKRHQGRLAGCHFFKLKSSNIDHNNLRAVLIALAHGFCDVFSNYISMLPRIDKLQDLVSNGSVAQLYDQLIYTPLTSPALQVDQDQHQLLVFDAVDECDYKFTDLVIQIIKNFSENSPEWLYLLVTAKNDNQITSALDNIKVIELKKSNENMADIKRYLKEPMGMYIDRISLDGALNQLIKKTDGTFLSAYILKQRLCKLDPSTKIAMREVDGMYPVGLQGNFAELLAAFQDSLSNVKGFKDLHKTLLSIMVAAQEPLPKDFVELVLPQNKVAIVHDSFSVLSEVLIPSEETYEFCSSFIEEILLEDTVDIALGREQMATLCTKILGNILGGDTSHNISQQMRTYALKHVIYHLTDIPKQQENISKILCSLKFQQEKLNLEGVHTRHLLADYNHEHVQNTRGVCKVVSLKDYMKKSKWFERIRGYEKFLQDKRYDIKQCPEFLIHVAANYAAGSDVQMNARNVLAGHPWIEDVTSVPDTPCITRELGGSVKAVDVSSDGSVIAAVSKDDEYNLRLHIIDTNTGRDKVAPLDIKSLNDRVGLLAKFMPNGNIFVGSLTTHISPAGKVVQSGLDVRTVELKEKFSIECCDVSQRYFACGLNTFPWGGRSLHMCVFDLRTKKCLKTLEVLHFRYGGNASFGVKCVGLASNKPLMCACIKQNTKAQLRVIVWNITKFQVVNSIDVSTETISKCLFVGEQHVLLGSSIRSLGGTKHHVEFTPVITEMWKYADIKNKASEIWDEKESRSLFSSSGGNTFATRWYKDARTAIVEMRSMPEMEKPPTRKYRIRGLSEVSELLSANGSLVFGSPDEIFIYNVDELESLGTKSGSESLPVLQELHIKSLSFLPKSNTVVIVSEKDELISVYLSDLGEAEMNLSPTPFKNEKLCECMTIDPVGQFRCFLGPSATAEICHSSADGNIIIFNTGDTLKIWERNQKSQKTIPTYSELKSKEGVSFREYTKVMGFASPKDNTIAVIYGQLPHKIHLYDLRTCNLLKTLVPEGPEQRAAVTDLAFLPSNGFIVTYHRHMQSELRVWNSRSGDNLSASSLPVSYGRASPASDRIVISARKVKGQGQLFLRNSDNKFCKELALSSVWLPSCDDSDIEFSSDGTVLVGICSNTGIFRVWNAGNGDVLQDLPNIFTINTEVLGLLTNTHVLMHDDRLVAMDIASGNMVSFMPLDAIMDCKTSHCGLRISPKGTAVAGTDTSGNICVFHCHNFETIRMKTTLQRLKSLQK